MPGLPDYQWFSVILGGKVFGELSLTHQMGNMLTRINT